MLDKFKDFYNGLSDQQIFWLIVFFCLAFGPILLVICKICQLVFFIIKFNFNFLLPKEKTKDSESTKSSNISINNSPPVQKDNLSLIELKMIELNQREYNNKNEQLQHNNFLQLELNQKLHQNKMEGKFELYKLEQKISSLEKDIERLSANKNFQNKNSEVNSYLDFVENDIIKKQIPESLKEIFEKISDFENVQLFMLNKMIDNEKKSYYDSNQNALYINPKDFSFLKTFLVNKQKENKKLN